MEFIDGIKSSDHFISHLIGILEPHAVHGREFYSSGLKFNAYSSESELLDFWGEMLDEDEPDHTAPIVTFIAEPIQKMDLEYLSKSALKKTIEQPEIGKAGIYTIGDQCIIEIDGLGLLASEGKNRFICFSHHPDGFARAKGHNFGKLTGVLISEALLGFGRMMAHAGAVGMNGRCRILTGPSGAGKTTKVLSLVEGGWDFYGDDLIALGRNPEGVWTVWPHWRLLRVTRQTCRLIPFLSEVLRPEPSEEKHLFNINEVFDVNKPGPGRLEVINIIDPEFDNEYERLSPGEAFSRLAPEFLHSLSVKAAGRQVELLLDLVHSVPVNLISRHISGIPV